MEKFSSVLLVDGDSTHNFLNERLFKHLHVTDHLLTAEDGARALDLIAHPVDLAGLALILLDAQMPGPARTASPFWKPAASCPRPNAGLRPSPCSPPRWTPAT